MSTVLLKGQVITEGVKFLWWITDGTPTRITVSHAVYGTRTETAQRIPEHQAKTVARRMLVGAGASESV